MTMQTIVRDIVYQPFNTYPFTVGVNPTRLADQISITKQDLIDSIVISVPAAAANNVFIGGLNVSTANGLEIVAGSGPIDFVIENQRQHYEIQEPVIAIAETQLCAPVPPRSLPYIVWDFSQIYMVAINVTVITIAPFGAMFI